MGFDIFGWVEAVDTESGNWKAVKDAFPADAFERDHYGVSVLSAPFRNRTYGLFGFLANVANYACCEVLSPPRGFPPGCDLVGGSEVIDELEPPGCLFERPEELLADGFFAHSYFSLAELLNYDYDKVFADQREGILRSYRALLGQDYFEALEVMKTLGPFAQVRVVFCFSH